MKRTFLLAGAFTGLVMLGACSDSLRLVNLTDRPLGCRVYNTSGAPPDIASDLAAGGTLRVELPGTDSLDGCTLSVRELSAGPPPQRDTVELALERHGSRRFAVRATGAGLAIGPELGQKR